jgi:fused signal recognition particle receptor
MSWFQRLRQGLTKTRNAITQSVGLGEAVNDEQQREWTLEELEFALIGADVGAKYAQEILDDVREQMRQLGQRKLGLALQNALSVQLEPDQFRAKLRKAGFSPDAKKSTVEPKGHVVLMVGVNGVGKTTTIAKLGQYYQSRGQSVMFAAGDTFRAAAGAQLGVWGERLGVEVIQGPEGGDPAAIAFDAASARKARGIDLLFVDTAGRLHTKHNLMEELKKVKRTITKADANEPAEVWLVLDAVTGQNGLEQAKKFHEAVGLTGVVVTKLDGTAKGGIVVPIVRELGVPLKFVGVGEGADDLQPFDAREFVEALLSE